MTIKINIADKRARVEGEPVIVCGNSDYDIEFAFDSEWTNLADKKARFVWTSRGEQHRDDADIIGNTVKVPVLSGTSMVEIGVYGGNLRATTPARIPCEYSVRCVL